MANSQIEEAKRILKITDHMIYVTYPVMQESRLLIKILSHINDVMGGAVLSVLENEYAHKRIKSYADPKMNFKSFVESSERYGLSKMHLEAIKQVASFMELHSKSPMEFVKDGRLIIMSDGEHMEEITYENVKSLLSVAKDILERVENRLNLDSEPKK